MKVLRFDIAIFAILILGVIGTAMFFVGVPKPYGEFTVLSPTEHDALFDDPANGYHQVAEAIALVAEADQAVKNDLEAMLAGSEATAEAIAHLDAQQPALDLVGDAINRELFIVPRLDLEAAKRNPTARRARSQGQIRLGNLLILDGIRHARNDDSARAAEHFMESARYGAALHNGGTMMYLLIGLRIQGDALKQLLPLLGNLDEAPLKSITQQLDDLQQNAIPFGQIVANDLALSDHILSDNQIIRGYQNWQRSRMLGADVERTEIAYDLMQACLIGTRLRAQVRLFELEHGAPPASLVDLLGPAPVPVDPMTGTPFRLRTDGSIQSDGPSHAILSANNELIF